MFSIPQRSCADLIEAYFFNDCISSLISWASLTPRDRVFQGWNFKLPVGLTISLNSFLSQTTKIAYYNYLLTFFSRQLFKIITGLTILDLHKNWAQSSHMPSFIQVPLLLTSCITVVHLLQLLEQYLYIKSIVCIKFHSLCLNVVFFFLFWNNFSTDPEFEIVVQFPL